MVNFIIGSAYWMPTLFPLACACRRRGYDVIFFHRKNPKGYADISTGKKKEQLKKCCLDNGFKIEPIGRIRDHPGVTFLVEGDISGRSNEDRDSSGLFALTSNHIAVSLVWNFDFFWTYPKYIDHVRHVIFPNEIYARHYKRMSTKNVYLGNPKYELAERETINTLKKKFGLKSKKSYALVFYPKYTYFKNKCVRKGDLLALYDKLRSLGISIIVKTRDKDDVEEGPLRGDHYFVEESISSNTSIELLRMCRIACLFSSAALEECVMEGVPFIDFKVHKMNRLEFLHDKKHSRVLSPKIIHQPIFLDHVKSILSGEGKDSLKKTRHKYLFEAAGACDRILDFCMKLDGSD